MTPRRISRLACAAVATLAAALPAAGSALASPAGPAASARSAAEPVTRSGAEHGTYHWHVTPTGTDARLRGLSAVSRRVAWASGTEGTVLRTVDGGRHWASVGPPDTATLQFRDIEAFSAQHAVALSIGEGTDSRVYVTWNGGRTWRESFENAEPAAFYDCMAFADPRDGLAVSDPVDGTFRLIRTRDGGRSWSLVDPAGMPPAETGEAGFAASGTCLTTGPGGRVYLASGGVNPARVFVSTDFGTTWTVSDSPLAGSASAGIFSVRFRDRRHGILVGGDYLVPDAQGANAAWTSDGGRTWQLPRRTTGGYRSGSDWVARTRDTAIAVGPTGSDVTRTGGRTWTTFDTASYDSVECSGDGACWASGDVGRVATLREGPAR